MSRLVEKQLLHQQVYNILKKDILSGKLKSGEKVNENIIAQEFGVSRSPVREAIRMLEQDELVVMGTAGTLVNPLESHTLEDLYECRVVMESYAVRISTPYYQEEELKELHSFVQQSEQYFNKGCWDEVIQCNTNFHLCLIKSCKNERLIKTIKKYQELSYMARRQEFYTFHKDKSFIQEHRKIIQAIESRDQNMVEQRMRTHLQNDLSFYRQSNYSGS